MIKRFDFSAALPLVLAAAACLNPGRAHAAWPGDPTVNLPLCIAPNAQFAPLLVSESPGAATAAWTDWRGGNADLYAQHMDLGGDLGWGLNGASVCTTVDEQTSARIAADGQGGVILAWSDARLGIAQLYAQRLSPAGVRSWVPDGLAVCPSDSAQIEPAVVWDGANGAIVAWTDQRSGERDIYAQRLDASGAPLWPVGGVAVCAAAGVQERPVIVTDGANGAIVLWADARGGYYAQRLSDTGVPQWTPDGVLACSATSRLGLVAAPDGAGGVIAAWVAPTTFVFNMDIYSQRLDSGGLTSWSPGGVALCTSNWEQRLPAIAVDVTGNAIVAWDDHRSFHVHQIFAQRVNGAGVPSWTPNGISACETSSEQFAPAMDGDGAGGAVLAWRDNRRGELDIFAQRFDAAGARLWTPDGVAVSTAPDTQTTPAIVGDGLGGAFIAWADRRNGTDYDIYAQRVLPTGQLSLVGVPGSVPDAGLSLAAAPNPARTTITVRLGLVRDASLALAIYDIGGRRVRELAAGRFPAGEHVLGWDLRDDADRPVGDGLYFVRLDADGRALGRRIAVIH